MKLIAKRAKAALVLLILFLTGLILFYFNFGINGNKWAMSSYNRHIYKNGTLQNSGTIVDRDGVVLAETKDGKRKYNGDTLTRKSLLHVVGDNTSYLSGSIQTSYASTLAGYNIFNGVHMLKEWNSVPTMQLTVSAAVNKKVAYSFGNRKGAVIAYNYKTGDIIVSLSSPNYDPQNKPSNMDSDRYEGVYVNRTLQGLYPPGSTFKLITATAAIENMPDIMSRKFNCTGRYELPDGGEIVCNSNHGEIDFATGLEKSCNVVFAKLAIELGAEKMQKAAEKYGFNSKAYMGNISVNGGYYNTKGVKTVDIGWSGIGQNTVLASPFTMMTVAGSIANSGVKISPKVIKSVKNAVGVPVNLNLSLPSNVISSDTAAKIKAMMKKSAVYSFGESFANKYSLYCKTGTAEVDDGKPHSWLVGFSDDSTKPYAFAIIIENGGTAKTATKSVAEALLEGINSLK